MIRKMYYLLPPYFRYLVRRIIYFPYDLLLARNNTIVPPRGMIYTGSKDFIRQGIAWKDLFIQYGGLQDHHTVLDIGSGIGRVALGLTSFLKGSYEGFDAVRLGVDWCNKNISPTYPNFNFQFIDLFNDLYKSKGLRAATFQFPYSDDSFDFACAISVFTHMLPDELENYLTQLHRTLKNRGHAVLTFFVLDDESISLMKNQKDGIHFDHIVDAKHALMDANVKSANVGYQRTYLKQLLHDQHFQIIHEFKGRWCGRASDHSLAFQDVLVIEKID